MVNITRHSKAWWNKYCCHTLNKYWQIHSLENWKNFKSTVKKSKYTFFDDKIDEITNKKCGPWKLINWVKKCKLPAVEAIQYEEHSCIKLEDLWNTLYSSFNFTQAWEVDIYFLDEIPDKTKTKWNLFSKKELIDTIEKYNNLSALGLDKLMWSHIKSIIRNKDCICKFIDITNACINLEYWLSHFKTLTMVVIPKPNKTTFNSPKLYCPIVLLNTIGKLFKKMIGEHLQFHMISNNFIYPSQLKGLKQRSILDMGIILTHIIQSG